MNLEKVNRRVKNLASAQSVDIAESLSKAGVQIVKGRGRLTPDRQVEVDLADGTVAVYHADVILLATGVRPREVPEAMPDGERILNWKQVYNLKELPPELIVVGSGVTGAEFAGAYQALGSTVTLVSSRDRVLPGEDADAAEVLESVFRRRGMRVLSRSRAASAVRDGDRVIVTLEDGRTVEGSHVLMAVGSLPNTEGLGLEEAGVELTKSGHIEVDRVSAHLGARRLRGRRRHRRAAAGLGGRDAGPDRDVPRARRGGVADQPQAGLVQHLHQPRGGHGRADQRQRAPRLARLQRVQAGRWTPTPARRCWASRTAS